MKRWKAVLLTGILLGSMAVGGCGAAKGVKGNDAKEESKQAEETAANDGTVVMKKKYNAKNAPKSPLSEEGLKVLNASHKGSFAKIIVSSEDGTNSTFDAYDYATIDLDKKTASVVDATDAKNKDINADIFKMTPSTQSFSQLYGFDNTACSNATDLYTAFAREYNMDFDQLDFKLDKEMYEYEGEKQYTFTPSAEAVNATLNGAAYDKITNAWGVVDTYELQDKHLFPEEFTVFVTYEKDGHSFTKSMGVGFTPDNIEDKLNESGSGCSCGCGHKDESECNDSCGHDKKAKTDSCKDSMTCK